jgi:hypothetical protein
MVPRSLIISAVAITVLLLAAVFAYKSYWSPRAPIYADGSAPSAHASLEIPDVNKLARPQGSPAIKANTTAVPGYTLDDVKQFVTAHPIRTSPDGAPPATISRAEFMSSKQVSELLNGTRTGFPDDYMLCYVELAGAFTFSGPMGATRTYQRGFEVFDASTGNRLMVGGLPG